MNEKLCEYCGMPIENLVRSNQKYCSVSCKNKAYNRRKNGIIKERKRKDKPKATLNSRLAELREQGISYADWQREQTLNMVRGTKW